MCDVRRNLRRVYGHLFNKIVTSAAAKPEGKGCDPKTTPWTSTTPKTTHLSSLAVSRFNPRTSVAAINVIRLLREIMTLLRNFFRFSFSWMFARTFFLANSSLGVDLEGKSALHRTQVFRGCYQSSVRDYIRDRFPSLWILTLSVLDWCAIRGKTRFYVAVDLCVETSANFVRTFVHGVSKMVQWILIV